MRDRTRARSARALPTSDAARGQAAGLLRRADRAAHGRRRGADARPSAKRAGIAPARDADRHAGRRVPGARRTTSTSPTTAPSDDVAPAAWRRRSWSSARAPTASAARVEFDWCCVNAVAGAARARATRPSCSTTTRRRSAPTTTSATGCYFDEISLETVLEIYEREQPLRRRGRRWAARSRTTSRCGCTAAGRAHPRHVGRRASTRAEDRHKFCACSTSSASTSRAWAARRRRRRGAERSCSSSAAIPVLVRPCYVLSGAAMSVAHERQRARAHPRARDRAVSPRAPGRDQQVRDPRARDRDRRAWRDDGELVLWAISEHIENAGVHSGDATLVLPPQRSTSRRSAACAQIARAIARGAQRSPARSTSSSWPRTTTVKVIECNLRASRSFPFVSKVYGANFVAEATRRMLGRAACRSQNRSRSTSTTSASRRRMFSFSRLVGADPMLGVEMASHRRGRLLRRRLRRGAPQGAALGRLPPPDARRAAVDRAARGQGGVPRERAQPARAWASALTRPRGTAAFLRAERHRARTCCTGRTSRRRRTRSSAERAASVDLVINIPKNSREEELRTTTCIRRKAADLGIPLITNIQLAQRLVEALSKKGLTSCRSRAGTSTRRRPA